MKLKFQDGKVTISMRQHIEKAIAAFDGSVSRKVPSPGKRYLFEVRENRPKLDETRAENFHSVVASLLYISRRCQ